MKTPFDNYELIAAELTAIGWDSPGDAQWDGLKIWCEDKSADFKISNLQKELSTLSNVPDERVEPAQGIPIHLSQKSYDDMFATIEHQAAQIARLKAFVLKWLPERVDEMLGAEPKGA